MTKCFDQLECGDPVRCAAEGACRNHVADEIRAGRACADCENASRKSHHGFMAGCRGCCARACARGVDFHRVRKAGQLDHRYRLALRQFNLTHEDVKAAAAADVEMRGQG